MRTVKAMQLSFMVSSHTGTKHRCPKKAAVQWETLHSQVPAPFILFDTVSSKPYGHISDRKLR